MSDDRVEINFDFEVDGQSVNRIQKALDNIAKRQERVATQFKKGNLSLNKATVSQKKLNSEKTELLALEKSLNAAQNRRIQKQDEEIENERRLTEQSKSTLRAKQDQFDIISRDVSAAGDFQSNLGALRGLSSAAGLGGVSQALDIGGESVALIEELPRLAAATAALPATIKASSAALLAFKTQAIAGLPSLLASVSAGFFTMKAAAISFLISLGPLGIAALVVTVVIAALTAALLVMKKRADDAAKAARKVSKQQKEAEKLTTEQAENRLIEVQREQERLAELRKIREASGKSTKDLTKQEKELNSEAAALTTVLGNGTTAINDISEAEASLADQRTNAALEAGEDAANLVKIQQAVREANTEELNQIINNLNKKKEVLQAERDALQESGDQSAETRDAIENLNDAMGDIDEQLNEASSSASRAAAAERTLSEQRTKTRAETEKKQAAADKKVFEERKKAEQKTLDLIKKAGEEANKQAQKVRDIQLKANEDLIKLQDDFRTDSIAAFRDAKRGELAETRKADKGRKDLLKDLSRQEKDLIASGDIFAIQDIREQASENLEDLREDFDFDANERRIQRRNETQDRLREAQEQRRKLRETALAQLADLGVGQKAIQTGWRSMLTGLGNDLQAFASAITGNAGNAAGQTQSVSGIPSIPTIGLNVSIDGAPIQAIVQNEIAAVT